VQIANPIYDVVFKYMMDDNKVAKLLISAIIGEEIIELDFRPTEYRSDIEAKSLTVYRMDFSAKIKTGKDKFKTVIIEIQKAKYHTDIMRFRRYLGIQYQNKDNSLVDDNGHRKAFPIISIYFLGHRLKYAKSSIIKVNREYIDCITGERIKEREEFIECLTHDSYIIQIPELSHRRRNELEQILSIFDQSSADNEDSHVLNINENHYPEKYKPVIRALIKAISEPKVRKDMTIEDDIIEEMENIERALNKKILEIAKEKQRAEEEKQRAEEEKQRAEEEKQRAEEEKQRAEEEKQRAEEEKQRAEEEKQRAEEEKQRAEEAELRAMNAEKRAKIAERELEKLKAITKK